MKTEEFSNGIYQFTFAWQQLSNGKALVAIALPEMSMSVSLVLPDTTSNEEAMKILRKEWKAIYG